MRSLNIYNTNSYFFPIIIVSLLALFMLLVIGEIPALPFILCSIVPIGLTIRKLTFILSMLTYLRADEDNDESTKLYWEIASDNTVEGLSCEVVIALIMGCVFMIASMFIPTFSIVMLIAFLASLHISEDYLGYLIRTYQYRLTSLFKE